MAQFEDGDRAFARNRRSEVTIIKLLGAGSQGEVYEVKDFDTENRAMKWYFPQQATHDQRRTIAKLIEMGSPDPARFIWPQDLIDPCSDDFGHENSFGYIMPLREKRFISIPTWLKREANPTFWSLSTAALNIVEAFLALHSKGYVYRDINDGNIFLDPKNGDIAVCDNDNVGISGEHYGVIGTNGFMAPEVAIGHSQPTNESDLYALSVLLFRLLIVHHPLIGKRTERIHCKDPKADRYIYVSEPLFIYDPADRSNEPDPEHHKNALAFWPLYPSFLRNAFTRAFTVGLREPVKRVRVPEWKKTLYALRDSLFPCPICGDENFFDKERIVDGTAGTCLNCKRILPMPARIRIGMQEPIMLHSKTQLFAHHLGLPEHQYSGPVAQVISHPSQPNVTGLRNLTSYTWEVSTTGRQRTPVPPNANVTIQNGVKILFSGNTTGEIRI